MKLLLLLIGLAAAQVSSPFSEQEPQDVGAGQVVLRKQPLAHTRRLLRVMHDNSMTFTFGCNEDEACVIKYLPKAGVTIDDRAARRQALQDRYAQRSTLTTAQKLDLLLDIVAYLMEYL